MSTDTPTFLKLLADHFSLQILNYIAKAYDAGEVNGTSIPISKTSLTRRQYYTRLSGLAKMKLIVRNNNEKYSITLFGRLINAEIVAIAKLLDNYWKLLAIDSIREAPTNAKNSDPQFIALVNNLIQDPQVKKLIFGSYTLRTEQVDIIASGNGY